MYWRLGAFLCAAVCLAAALGFGFAEIVFTTNRSEREQFKAEHHCKPVGQKVDYRQIWICDGGAMTLL